MNEKKLQLLLIIFCCLFSFGFRWSYFFGELQWQQVNDEIESAYPDVVSMTTDELRDLLGQEDILIVDVRELEEYTVSHLPGAVLSAAVEEGKIEKDQLVVAYCSVGLRSAAFVRKMQEKGFTHMYNLKGSIFEWANKGYSLRSGSRKVVHVHPYNERWGVLLKKELHDYGRGD